MAQAVDLVLAERSRPGGLVLRTLSLASSLLLHAALLGGLLVAPMLAAKSAEPLEFVAVQIVPIQALGVKEPVPSAPPRRRPPEPAPKEEPEEEPRPEPEADRRRAPEPETRPERRKPPAPEAREEEASSWGPPPADALEQRPGSPRGSSLGTAAFGATVGGLDNPDFVYSYYVDQMLAMISANWLRPALGGEIEAIVHFRIHRQGEISDLRIVKSSGYNSFDLAGLRAVQLAAPFPNLPQSYRHGSLGVNLILR